MIRFLLDQHVPHAIARGLRLRGVAVLTAGDAGLLTKPDEEIAAYALREGLVIFTQDDDFLKLNARGVPHAGIVYSQQERRKPGEVVRFLKLLCDCLDSEDMRGEVEYF